MKVLEPEKIITTISNLKTGEKYSTEEEWKAKGVPESDIRRDVRGFITYSRTKRKCIRQD